MAYPVVSDDQIEGAVAELVRASVPFDRLVCRTSGKTYANPRDITSGVGAALKGQRWNGVGLRAIYFGLDQTTAAAESDPSLRLGCPAGTPRIIEAWHIQTRVARCAPIETPSALALLGVSLDELMAEPYASRVPGSGPSVAQRIGAECVRQDLNALEYPSQRNKPKGRCVVIFPDVLPPPEFEFPPETASA